MKLARDGSEPRRGVYRIRHDNGTLGPLLNLGRARQVIRQHVEDELKRQHHAIEAEREKARQA
jgi:hypothetical protein